MSARVTTAVVLAAGMGTRLKDLGKTAPKGFLRLGEKTIIEESLDKLRASGITRIIFVTGHVSEMYEELAGRSGGCILTVKNGVFADSGSGYSLFTARQFLGEHEDFLLLESDLIYEKRALGILLDDPRPDLILLSGKTSSGDEVYVQTRGGNLLAMSKDKSLLEEIPGCEIMGELVGISKISGKLYAKFIAAAGRIFEKSLNVEYETCLTETAKTHPIACHLAADLAWAEIDDENHLARARETVYRKTVWPK